MGLNLRKIFKVKYIFTFIALMIIYFLPSILFPIDKDFYNSLDGFKIPSFVFIIVWTLIYIFISIFITYHIYIPHHKNLIGSYKRLIAFLVLNYIFMFLYTLVFFKFQNLFLGYIMCLFTFLTILLAMMESMLINKKSSFLLLPYTLWTLFASFLAIMFYLEN